MKGYTDIEQSKQLAEILPLESADMRYSPLGDSMHPWIWTDTFIEKDAVPCWSLSALLDVFPSVIKRNGTRMFLTLEKAGAYNLYYKSSDRLDELWETNFEPIDACYEMIIKLKEMNLLMEEEQ